MSAALRPHRNPITSALIPLSVCMLLFLPAAAIAQQSASSGIESEQVTTTGTVSSSSQNTMVVKNENGRYQLFTFERNTQKPRSIVPGSRVEVISTPSGEEGVRIASSVRVLSAPSAAPAPSPGGTAATTAGTRRRGQGDIISGSEEAVPSSIRDIQESIERQVKRFRVGVRTGVALDPEVILAGVHAQFATGFSRNVIFRPSVEFGWGELTTMFAINLEGIYRLPVSPRQGRWAAYVGLGPQVNFIHQGLSRKDRNVDFGDFDTTGGLSILGGIQYRSGMFVELKTTVYAEPAPTLRLMLGYNF